MPLFFTLFREKFMRTVASLYEVLVRGRVEDCSLLLERGKATKAYRRYPLGGGNCNRAPRRSCALRDEPLTPLACEVRSRSSRTARRTGAEANEEEEMDQEPRPPREKIRSA